ncbi:MAG: hypothetical protein ACTTJN_00525 [Prevotella intermedia]
MNKLKKELFQSTSNITIYQCNNGIIHFIMGFHSIKAATSKCLKIKITIFAMK